MMALLWDDIAADIASAKRHFGEAGLLFRSHRADPASYVTAMAFQHAMQAGYTSFETAMKRLLALLGEPLPVDPDSHAALLRRLGRAVPGSRPPVLDADLLAHAEALRRFRHVAMHAYDDFAFMRAETPALAAEAVVTTIDAALARFRAAIDPAP